MRAEPGIKFANQSHDFRMHAYRIANQHGESAGFAATGNLDVLMPRDGVKTLALVEAMASIGMEFRHAYLFPIGSDNVRDELRHDGSYPGSKGFTLTAAFAPKDVSPPEPFPAQYMIRSI